TSKTICDSLVGAMTPVTRQNGGRSAIGFVEPGGVKEPVVIACAAVIVALVSFCPARLAQPELAAALGATARIARIATVTSCWRLVPIRKISGGFSWIVSLGGPPMSSPRLVS